MSEDKLRDEAFDPDLREQVIWRLAERLFEIQERLDPGYDMPWSELTDIEREFFYHSINGLFTNGRDAVLAVALQSNSDAIMRWAKDPEAQSSK